MDFEDCPTLEVAAEILEMSIERVKHIAKLGSLTLLLPAEPEDRFYYPDSSSIPLCVIKPRSRTALPPIVWKEGYLLVVELEIAYGTKVYNKKQIYRVEFNKIRVDPTSMEKLHSGDETLNPKAKLKNIENQAESFAKNLKIESNYSNNIIAALTRIKYGTNGFNARELINWLEIEHVYKDTENSSALEKQAAAGRKLIHEGKNKLKGMKDNVLKEMGISDRSVLD